MNAFLLYENSDRLGENPYYDGKSIVQDLGLKALFLAAAKEVIYENDAVKRIDKEDLYIQDTMRRILLVPVMSKEEMIYRQEIVRDSLANEELMREMYRISSALLAEWNKLGRGLKDKISQSNPVVKLISDIQVAHLFVNALHRIGELLQEAEGSISSRGLRSLRNRLKEEFSEEREAYVRKILADISFYTDGSDQEDEGKEQVVKPKIILECGLEDGLKFSSLKLQEVSSASTKFYRPGSTMDKLQDFKNSRIPDSFSTVKEVAIRDQADQLEYSIVNYLMGSLGSFMHDFSGFFDQLHMQTAFYVGAINLKHHMVRFSLNWCFPSVCAQEDLSFVELKEFVMCLEQRVFAIGNTCGMKKKELLIVTGANQGGKSTFLRSIGIAQVMMQGGLMVTAEQFKSGLFPRLYMHFTRREDSAMNSGRLDEELNRMNKIVENLKETAPAETGEKDKKKYGAGAMILLNESFATTTEKEGSVIAYDIIRALGETGVKILTVTHLLTFAQQMYEEYRDNPDSIVEFLSAERKSDGTRTFHMIQHAPELTSFGLDLYDELVEKRGKES